MNRWRKTITLLLMLLFALSLFSVTAYAEGTDAASMACTSCGGTGLYNGAECGDCGGTGLLTSQSRMAFSFWALVPPIVAIILALITRYTPPSSLASSWAACFTPTSTPF